MKFCQKLCEDINFEPHGIQPCCNVHATKVPVMPFSGGKLGAGAYAAHIQSIADKLQWDDALCKGCPELVEIPETSLNASLCFKNILINMNRNICNCRCVYCNLWKETKKSYPILQALKSLFQHNMIHPACLVSWGGGEPSILKEFEEAAGWISRQHIRQHIFTNAIRFSPAIRDLLQYPGNAITVSLDSASREVYKKVKQVDKYDDVVANLKRYALGSGNPYSIYLKYIIFEENNNMDEIEKFLDLCVSLGVANVELSFNFHEVNSGGPSEKTLLAASFFEDRAKALGLLCEKFYIKPQNIKMIEAAKDKHFAQ